MAGVTTCVCVSTTIREGVEYNYRMIIASDAVAEVHRIFADVKSTDEVDHEAGAGLREHGGRNRHPSASVVARHRGAG